LKVYRIILVITYFQSSVFCDIPLSKTKFHLDWYGNYGLGIRQETLKKIGVSPVLYVHETMVNEVIKPMVRNTEFHKIIALTKKYSGTTYSLQSDGTYRRTTRKFYDEREWRYVPKNVKIKWYKRTYGIQEGLDEARKLNKEQPYLDDSIQLSFFDIDYIIVKDVKDFTSLIDVLRRKFPNQDEFQVILTKVMTAKQIKKDF
jgi:hypothetical protein